MKQLETPRLMIRNFTLEDAEDLHEILGDDEVMKYCEPAYSMEKTRTFLASFCIDRGGAVAAVEKRTRKMIGYILLNESVHGVYEMGWFLNRSYWRQGYAYEACKAMIDFAFRELDAHKVFAETIDGVKSVGLMEKLGMTIEGIQRSHTLDNAGNWADFHLYGLLREEWERQQGASS